MASIRCLATVSRWRVLAALLRFFVKWACKSSCEVDVSKLAASLAGSVEVRALDWERVPASLWMENLFLIHGPSAELSPLRRLHTLCQTHTGTRQNIACWVHGEEVGSLLYFLSIISTSEDVNGRVLGFKQATLRTLWIYLAYKVLHQASLFASNMQICPCRWFWKEIFH